MSQQDVKSKATGAWRTIVGWAFVVAGAAMIAAGWYGVSGDPNVARQLSYLASGGIGGLAAAIVGVGLLIGEDLRSERKRLGRIESSISDVRSMLREQLGAELSDSPPEARSQSK